MPHDLDTIDVPPLKAVLVSSWKQR